MRLWRAIKSWEYILKAWVKIHIISEIGKKSNISGYQGRETESLGRRI